jgi:hypothetical protein
MKSFILIVTIFLAFMFSGCQLYVSERVKQECRNGVTVCVWYIDGQERNMIIIVDDNDTAIKCSKERKK